MSILFGKRGSGRYTMSVAAPTFILRHTKRALTMWALFVVYGGTKTAQNFYLFYILAEK